MSTDRGARAGQEPRVRVRHDLGMAATPDEPTRVVLDSAALEDLGRRLRTARMTADADGTWARGTPVGWLAELIIDWQAFDPVALQARLDKLTHLRVQVDEVSVHVMHAAGTGTDPVPLLLTHGWPSSFLEYSKLLPLLTDPAAHGGTAADAFSVVAPSLPGFGFSGPPPAGGLTHEQVAELWHRIMTEALGYRRFVAHGSDLGAGVTARLARAHPEGVAAIHLATPGLAAPPQPWSQAVREHFDKVEQWSAEEGGYAHMHATKPATIGAALDDSPVALAAWIGESSPGGAARPPTASPRSTVTCCCPRSRSTGPRGPAHRPCCRTGPTAIHRRALFRPMILRPHRPRSTSSAARSSPSPSPLAT